MFLLNGRVVSPEDKHWAQMNKLLLLISARGLLLNLSNEGSWEADNTMHSLFVFIMHTLVCCAQHFFQVHHLFRSTSFITLHMLVPVEMMQLQIIYSSKSSFAPQKWIIFCITSSCLFIKDDISSSELIFCSR